MRDYQVSALGEATSDGSHAYRSWRLPYLALRRAAVFNLVADRFQDARERPAATQRKCMSQDLSEAIAILSLSQQFR